MKLLIKSSILILLTLFLIQSVLGADQILIKGRLVDQLTGEPIEGAELTSAYEFSPSEVRTDSNGNFAFNVDINFRPKGSTEGDVGGQWTFFRRCYDYTYIGLQKDYNGYGLALRETPFDSKERVKDISGQSVIDLGELKAYPMVDISVKTDKNLAFTVQYKYKNLEGYNGGGNMNYKQDHYSSNALPVNYDVFIKFTNKKGEPFVSTTHHVPQDVGCEPISLKYFEGQSEWSIGLTQPEQKGFFGRVWGWFKNLF